MNTKGFLVISLDFELLWGVFDVVDYREKRKYFYQTREVIPEILNIFSRYGIKTTWATVGMLFNENWEEWYNNIPLNLPYYENKKLSAYEYGREIQNKNTEDLCFAPDLVKLILETPGQEVGTHTYSHYYCLEPGQDRRAFMSDIQAAKGLGEKLGIQLKSLVFPRNQLNREYLDICLKMGIENVRSNPEVWYWADVHSNSIFIKLARTGDAYFPLGPKSYSIKEKYNELKIFGQKASRFLRPVESNILLRKLKLKRIISEMTTAARQNQIYHLWWHPHNFGNHPKESLEDLIIILDHFRYLQEVYAFQSVNMQELNGSFGQD